MTRSLTETARTTAMAASLVEIGAKATRAVKATRAIKVGRTTKVARAGRVTAVNAGASGTTTRHLRLRLRNHHKADRRPTGRHPQDRIPLRTPIPADKAAEVTAVDAPGAIVMTILQARAADQALIGKTRPAHKEAPEHLPTVAMMAVVATGTTLLPVPVAVLARRRAGAQTTVVAMTAGAAGTMIAIVMAGETMIAAVTMIAGATGMAGETGTNGAMRPISRVGAPRIIMTAATGTRIGTAMAGTTAGAGTSRCVTSTIRTGGTTTMRGGSGITAACAGAKAIQAGATAATVGKTATGRAAGPPIAGVSAGKNLQRAGAKLRP